MFNLSWLTVDWIEEQGCQEDWHEWVMEGEPIFYFQSTKLAEIIILAERVETIRAARPDLWEDSRAEEWVKTALLFENEPAALALRKEFLPESERSMSDWYWQMLEDQKMLDWIPRQLAAVLENAAQWIPHHELHYHPMVISYKWDALGWESDPYQCAPNLFILGENYSTLAQKTESYLAGTDFWPEKGKIEIFVEGFLRWAEDQSDAKIVHIQFEGTKRFCGEKIRRLARERIAEFWSNPEYISDCPDKALRVVLVLGKALPVAPCWWQGAVRQICELLRRPGLGRFERSCDMIIQKYLSPKFTTVEDILDD